MIHIIWTGLGWVVPAATFGVSLLSEIVWEAGAGDDEYYQTHGFPFALALWISAGIVFAVYWSQYHAAPAAGRGKKQKKRKRPAWGDHAFFFINLWAWSAFLGVLGLGVLIGRGI